MEVEDEIVISVCSNDEITQWVNDNAYVGIATNELLTKILKDNATLNQIIGSSIITGIILYSNPVSGLCCHHVSFNHVADGVTRWERIWDCHVKPAKLLHKRQLKVMDI